MLTIPNISKILSLNVLFGQVNIVTRKNIVKKGINFFIICLFAYSGKPAISVSGTVRWGWVGVILVVRPETSKRG